MVIIITTSLVSQTRWTFSSDKNLEPVSRNFLLIITFASNFEDSVIMDLTCISVPVRKFFFEENFPAEKFELKICFISHNCLSEHNVRIRIFFEHLSDEAFIAIFRLIVFHDFNDIFRCLEITFRVIPHYS